jgi:hypothetical protein
VETRAKDISDESIKATIIDPLQMSSGLIQPPCDSFEWHQESGGFRWAAVGDANSSTHGDTHTKYEYVGM